MPSNAPPVSSDRARPRRSRLVRAIGAQVILCVDDRRLERVLASRLSAMGVMVVAVGDRLAAGDVEPGVPCVVVTTPGHRVDANRLTHLVPVARTVVVPRPPRRWRDRTVIDLRDGVDRADGDDMRWESFDAVMDRVRASMENVVAEHLARSARSEPERRLLVDAERRRSVDACGAFVVLRIAEHDRLREHHSRAEVDALMAEVQRVVAHRLPVRASFAAAPAGTLLCLVPGLSAAAAEEHLADAARDLAGAFLSLGDEAVQVTPVVGLADLAGATTVVVARDRAVVAAKANATTLDLLPTTWSARLEAPPEGPRPRRRLRQSLGPRTTGAQALLTLIAGFGVPYGVVQATGVLSPRIASDAFLAVVFALVGTAYLILLEHFYALRTLAPGAGPPPPPDGVERHPPATAVIAAYLPNESATVVATVAEFLRLDYDGPLQVVLAYNTPRHLPVEATLRAMAASDQRLTLLRVDGSTSKAQNVNAALKVATGEFIGVFDADHHPARDAFSRAARWLNGGYDVVQGHCVVRNGDASRLSSLVAVEFESMYAISHPGRANMAGFGVFGGSNGYWRAPLLRRIRMRPNMLTEDIDATMRALLEGARVASDPQLLSYELAPATFRSLLRQRLRWAQGWSQVARRYLVTALRSPVLSRQQKAGMLYLFGWREVYPWVALAVYPLLAYVALHPAPGTHLRSDTAYWFAALATLGVGPVQALFAYLLAAPTVRARKSWFGLYMALSIFYVEFKNVVARVAHLKELLGERRWNITPRETANNGRATDVDRRAGAVREGAVA